MPRVNRIATLALSLSASLALVACGGGDEGGEDEDKVTEVVETTYTTADPALCTDAMTQTFVEQITGESGEFAIENCEEGFSEAAQESVDVSNVEVDGDTATVELGGSEGDINEGQVLLLGLVKEGEQWKLDRIQDYAEFDQQAFADQLVKEAATQNVSPAVLECVEQTTLEADPEALQATQLENAPLEPLIGSCRDAA